MPTPNVWFITGASQGLGRLLVQQLLTQGYRVAATSRNADELRRAVGTGTPDTFLPLQVNLSDEASVAQAV